MKKILLATLLGALIVLCSACANQSDIPRGYVQKEEHFDEDGFQDYVDYCKYTYADASKVQNSPQFQKLTQEQVEDIEDYFEKFKEFIEAEKRSDEYDFSPLCINEGDYAYIKSKDFENFTVLFFDTQSNVLYYIHANI
ncbi:MAG: hypothetical protein IJJ41_02790 [Clostridia bacterium]|nr:hypothetical protein [Clostridia bacterium]